MKKRKRIEHKRIGQKREGKENKRRKGIEQKEKKKEQQKENEKNVEEQRIKYLENSASKVDLGIQVKEYINDKLDSLKSYDKYVCDHSGYDNQSPLCWNKHGKPLG